MGTPNDMVFYWYSDASIEYTFLVSYPTTKIENSD